MRIVGVGLLILPLSLCFEGSEMPRIAIPNLVRPFPWLCLQHRLREDPIRIDDIDSQQGRCTVLRVVFAER